MQTLSYSTALKHAKLPQGGQTFQVWKYIVRPTGKNFFAPLVLNAMRYVLN